MSRCPRCGAVLFSEADEYRARRLVCLTCSWDQWQTTPVAGVPDGLADSRVGHRGPVLSRRLPQHQHVSEMAELRRQGWSLERIGVRYGVDGSTVSAWLREWEQETGQRLPWRIDELLRARQAHETGGETGAMGVRADGRLG